MGGKSVRMAAKDQGLSTTSQSDATHRRNLRLIVILQYGLLIASSLGAAAALYLLILGPVNALLLASNAVVLAASGVSSLYLLLHQLGAWRYHRTRYIHESNDFHVMLDVNKALLGFAFIIWIAASVLGSMIASTSPFCEQNGVPQAYWETWSLTTCRLQKAEIALTFTALLTSMMLSWILRTTNGSFIASLAGIYCRSYDDEDVITLSPDISWPGRKVSMVWRPSCDTMVNPSPAERRATWLPNLNLETAINDTHPALRRPMLSRSQSDVPSALLPSPIPMSNPLSPVIDQEHDPPTLKRSMTATTACSSIYSRSLVSTCSRPSSATISTRRSSRSSRPSTISSSMELLSPASIPVPTIPAIYATAPKYPDLVPPALQIHPPRNIGRPVRPSSKPRMPPAKFWEYARNEQQKQNYLRQQVPIAKPAGVFGRHRDSVIRHRRRMQSEGNCHKIPSPPSSPITIPATRSSTPPNSRDSTTAVVGLWNMNKHNTMPIPTRGYEGVRKGYDFGAEGPSVAYAGRSVDFGIGFDVDGERTSPGRRESRGRVLVKKRQPWDREPRVGGGMRGL